jgi:pimeloyl-ACP methyl ester carboxylesterase
MPTDIKAAMVADVDLIDIEGFGNALMVTVPRSSVRNLLDKTQVPTLMIVGRYDKAFAVLQKVAKERIPDLTVKVFEAGHAVNIDAAEEFNAAVRDFILRFCHPALIPTDPD